MATNAQLTEQYNVLAKSLNLPEIPLWKNKKEILVARIEKLQEQVQAEKFGKAVQDLADGKSEEDQISESPDDSVEEARVEKPKRVKKAKAEKQDEEKTKSVEIVVEFLRAGLEKGDNPTAVLRLAHKQWPDMTRIQFKHSAKEAGINPLTARNLFDRLAQKGASE